MKLSTFAKNVAGFDAVDQPDSKESLAPSGRRDYGQMSVVITDEKSVSELEIGAIYTLTIEKDEESDEETEQQEQELP